MSKIRYYLTRVQVANYITICDLMANLGFSSNLYYEFNNETKIAVYFNTSDDFNKMNEDTMFDHVISIDIACLGEPLFELPLVTSNYLLLDESDAVLLKLSLP